MDPYNIPADVTLPRLKNIKNALKGHFTRREQAAQNHISFLDGKVDTSSTLLEIRQAIQHLKTAKDKVEHVISKLQEIDDTHIEDYATEFASLEARFSEIVNPLLDRIQVAESENGGAGNMVLPPEVTPLQKIDNTLAPKFILGLDHTPLEFRKWIKAFKGWYTQNQMHRMPTSLQHRYFFNHIDEKLVDKIDHHILEATKVFSDDLDEETCTTILEAEFRNIFPVFNRRLDFFTHIQASGQLFSETIDTIDKLSVEAQVYDLETDEIMVMRYLSACTNSKLREKLMRLENPSSGEVKHFVETWEKAKKQDSKVSKTQSTANAISTTSTPANVSATTSYQKGKKGKKKSSSSSTPSSSGAKSTSSTGSQNQSAKPKCKRCGGAHAAATCIYIDNTCHYCKKKGHIKPVCRLRLKDLEENKPSTSK